MSTTVDSVYEGCTSTLAEIDGAWVPARPINYQVRSLAQRIREAWAVFKGEADALYWPRGQ